MKVSPRCMKLTAAAILVAAAALLAAAPSVLRIGVLPDADSLPLLVAADEGLFAAEGVRVELLPFKTAVERDAALQAGAIDGAVTDLLAVALARQAGFGLKATSLTDGRYGLVVSPVSRIASLSELADLPVGVSSNTIIQYEAESMMAAAGVRPERMRSLAVPKIQLRMELLLAGRLEAACLPEPLLAVACAKGARLLAASDEAAPGRGLHAGVMAFTSPALEEKGADIAAFYRGYWKAASRIDAEPDSYRPFLVDKALFPAEARDSYRFVVYEKPRLPSEADSGAVLAWMKSKGLLSAELSPSDLVDARPVAAAAAGGAASGW